MSTALDTSMNDGQLGDVELEHAKVIEGAPASWLRVDRQFDQQSERDWCNLIRDIAAIANSDGGDLILRMPADAHALTRSDILRRINEYSDSAFDEVEVRALDSSQPAAVQITVGKSLFPIVFTKAGWYVDPNDAVTRIEAFPAGAIFFWHADKSVPGGTGDLREFFDRLVRRVRRRWIRGIRRVLTTPIDSLAQTTAGRNGAKSEEKRAGKSSARANHHRPGCARAAAAGRGAALSVAAERPAERAERATWPACADDLRHTSSSAATPAGRAA